LWRLKLLLDESIGLRVYGELRGRGLTIESMILERCGADLIEDQSIEDWLSRRVGWSPCCDIYGSHECRALEVEGKTMKRFLRPNN